MQYADYSAGRPSGAALKAAGFSGVIRYIGLGSEGKQLVASEYRDLVATFGAQNVLLVAEAGTGDAWGTDTDDDYARGVANGKIAVADARAQGVPDWVPLACAADAHAQAFQIDDVVRYARGFEAAVGKSRCGFYGFSETLAAVHNAGIGSWFWRCGSEPTAAEKQWVNFWQRNAAPTVRTVAGVPCDINDVYHPILQGDDVNLSDPITAYNANGTTYQTTVGDVLGKLPAVLQCVRPGNGWTVTDGWLSGALSNTNTRLPAVQTALDAIGTKLDAYEAADANRDLQLSAAVAAVQVGDVQALADALIPLLPKSATPDDVTAAIRAAFARAGSQ